MRQFFIDQLERAGTAFGFAAISTLIAITGNLAHFGTGAWETTAYVGLFAALTAVLTTAVTWLLNHRPVANPYADLVYRVLLQFGQTLLGLMVAAGATSLVTFDWSGALRVAALAAAMSFLKAAGNVHSPTAGASVFVK